MDLKIAVLLHENSQQCCVFHLSLFCLSTPSVWRSFQRGVALFCIINIAITTLPLTHTHTQSVEASWRQARASIKPVWVWEPFKGHFAPDLQSSILLSTAPQWPSGWPFGKRDRVREKGTEAMNRERHDWRERQIEMEKLWMKVWEWEKRECRGEN